LRCLLANYSTIWQTFRVGLRVATIRRNAKIIDDVAKAINRAVYGSGAGPRWTNHSEVRSQRRKEARAAIAAYQKSLAANGTTSTFKSVSAVGSGQQGPRGTCVR
jgi:hypothetical protein